MTFKSTIGFYRMRDTVKVPTFATEGSACFDLAVDIPINAGTISLDYFTPMNEEKSDHFSSPWQPVYLYPGNRYKIPTGLILDLPRNGHVKVVSRSGAALKKGLIVVNAPGIIDSDYVQEVFVLIQNVTDCPVIIEQGERIAQAQLRVNVQTDFEEMKVAPEKKTSRDGGFGSSGTK